VVDDAGQPLVMYHGTHRTGEIDSFCGFRGVAGHFAFDPKMASDFADYHVGSDTPDPRQGVIPVFLRAKDIFDLRDANHRRRVGFTDEYAEGDAVYEVLEHPDSLKAIRAAGFDAFYDFERSTEEDPTGIAVFRPEQIKSAIGNSTFDPNNADFSK
jgi:hypothetical protein